LKPWARHWNIANRGIVGWASNRETGTDGPGKPTLMIVKLWAEQHTVPNLRFFLKPTIPRFELIKQDAPTGLVYNEVPFLGTGRSSFAAFA
jgi:hypothetical protein